MSLFNITLFIAPEEMFCSACSKTIKNYVKNFLDTNHYSYDYITANFRKKTVEIVNIKVSASLCDDSSIKPLTDVENPHVNYPIEDLSDSIKRILDEGGYTCLRHHISSSEDERFLSDYDHLPQSTPLWHALLCATSGLGLMLAEHMNYLPSYYTKRGMAIDLAVGSVVTGLSGFMGKDYFKNAWKNQGAMDTLISAGVIVAIAYSFLLIAHPSFLEKKESPTYFSVPLMIFGFLKLSQYLKDQIHGHITAQLEKIETQKKQLPKIAKVYLLELENELNALKQAINAHASLQAFETKFETTYKVSEIQKDSIICVDADEMIPIDGQLLGSQEYLICDLFYGQKGNYPKKSGDIIHAGAINRSGQLIFLQTNDLAENNYLHKAYNKIRSESSDNETVEFISRYFLRIVMTAAAISSFCWGIFGPEPKLNNAIQVFFSMLISACPCGLGLIGINASMLKMLASEVGVLVNNKVFELDRVSDVCIDKCGTLTKGKYALEKIVSKDDHFLELSTYLPYVAALEKQIPKNERSAVADAILEAAMGIDLPACSAFFPHPTNKGRGGMAIVEGKSIIVGNKGLLKEHNIEIDSEYLELEAKYARKSQLPIFFVINKNIIGLLILNELVEYNQELRSNTKDVILFLIKQNKILHILTGDTVERSEIIKAQLELSAQDSECVFIVANRTPQQKADYIGALQQQGKIIMMIGDEVNDQSALVKADIGVAISTMASICDSADIILNGSFIGLAQLMILLKTYKQSYATSLFLVFGVNTVSLFLAAGVSYPFTQQLLDPMISGMAMIASSLLLMLCIAFFQSVARSKAEAASVYLSNESATQYTSTKSRCCFWGDHDKRLSSYPDSVPLLSYHPSQEP